MTRNTIERRRRPRTNVDRRIVRLQLDDHFGNNRWLTADLVDISDGGIGISVLAPLDPGATIIVRGDLGAGRPELLNPATVKWCTEKINGSYQAGLEFSDTPPATRSEMNASATPAPSEHDYYETMQLSPNADQDTIQRVYRVLAQRYHPDAQHTGNAEMFVRLSQAYCTLGNPELRAQYDVNHRETRQLHWKIFDQAAVRQGPEAEQHKRRGILELLYAKALHDPERASMTIFDFEQLLGCPREHLEAALWYLKGKAYVLRRDNGRFSITVQGFDEVERLGIRTPHSGQHLLESGETAKAQ